MFEIIDRLNDIREMHIKIVAKNTCYICVFIHAHTVVSKRMTELKRGYLQIKYFDINQNKKLLLCYRIRWFLVL